MIDTTEIRNARLGFMFNPFPYVNGRITAGKDVVNSGKYNIDKNINPEYLERKNSRYLIIKPPYYIWHNWDAIKHLKNLTELYNCEFAPFNKL